MGHDLNRDGQKGEHEWPNPESAANLFESEISPDSRVKQDIYSESRPQRLKYYNSRAEKGRIWPRKYESRAVCGRPHGKGSNSSLSAIRVAGAIKATHPDFSYQLIAEPEEVGNGGRVPWVSGRLGDAPAYAGTDFIITRDGRIAAIYLFFDKLS